MVKTQLILGLPREIVFGVITDNYLYLQSFSLTWPASEEDEKKSSTPIGLVWDTNMAAVSLFWDTNMTAVTSFENTL